MSHFPLLVLALLAAIASGPYPSFPTLQGPWLGQDPPGTTPVAFAPGLIKPSSGFHSTVVFNGSGDEAYWTAMASGESYISRLVDGVWTRPELLPFDPEYGVREPMPSPDGERLYYLSRRPLPDDPVERERIWSVRRTAAGWSEPQPIDPIVRAHPTHWQFSFNAAGDLFFTSECAEARGEQDIYVARRGEDGGFAEPRSVGAGVNTDAREFCPFVAPDESYLLFSRTRPGWRSDLYVSFRSADGTWSDAANLGRTLNLEHNEVCPVVTPDGEYLFFLRVSREVNEVFWVSSSVIAAVRR
jgi:hypothetical protein